MFFTHKKHATTIPPVIVPGEWFQEVPNVRIFAALGVRNWQADNGIELARDESDNFVLDWSQQRDLPERVAFKLVAKGITHDQADRIWHDRWPRLGCYLGFNKWTSSPQEGFWFPYWKCPVANLGEYDEHSTLVHVVRRGLKHGSAFQPRYSQNMPQYTRQASQATGNANTTIIFSPCKARTLLAGMSHYHEANSLNYASATFYMQKRSPYTKNASVSGGGELARSFSGIAMKRICGWRTRLTQ